VGDSSSNLRFADTGRGNGDDDSGSKAGSSDGFRVAPEPSWSGSKGNGGALVLGDECMVCVDGWHAKLEDVSCFDLETT